MRHPFRLGFLTHLEGVGDAILRRWRIAPRSAGSASAQPTHSSRSHTLRQAQHTGLRLRTGAGRSYAIGVVLA
jgi:hypothetical protein